MPERAALDEDAINQAVAQHRDRYSRMDVLINNAGVGIGAAIADAETKKLDMLTDWVEGQVPRDEMIQPEDIAEAVRFLLATSAACIVPEMMFIRPSDRM